MARITVKQGMLFGNTYDLSLPKQTIGSGDEDTIKVKEAGIIPHNATIYRRQDGSYFIDCKGERGSVLVNDKTISMTKLSHGDQIRIGETVFAFETQPGKAMPAQGHPNETKDSGHHLALEILQNYEGVKTERSMDSSYRNVILIISMFVGTIVLIVGILALLFSGPTKRESKEMTIRFEGDGIEVDGSRFNTEKISQLKMGNIKTEGVKIKNMKKGPKIQTGAHSNPQEKKPEKKTEQPQESASSNSTGGGPGISSDGQSGQGMNMESGPGGGNPSSSPPSSQNQSDSSSKPKPNDSAGDPGPMNFSQKSDKNMDGGGHLGDHMGDMGKKAQKDQGEPPGEGERLNEKNKDKLRKLLGEDKGGGNGDDPTADPLLFPTDGPAKANCAFQVDQHPQTKRAAVAVAMNRKGEFVVIWQNNKDILIRLFNKNGEVIKKPDSGQFESQFRRGQPNRGYRRRRRHPNSVDFPTN